MLIANPLTRRSINSIAKLNPDRSLQISKFSVLHLLAIFERLSKMNSKVKTETKTIAKPI